MFLIFVICLSTINLVGTVCPSIPQVLTTLTIFTTNSPVPVPAPTPAVSKNVATPLIPTQANIDVLGAAANYGILANTAITNTGTTTIYGAYGVSPTSNSSGAAITLYQGTQEIGNANSGSGQTSLTTAFNNLGLEPVTSNLTGLSLSGLVLTPGVYKYDSSCFLTAGGTLTLDAGGDPNAKWVFQIGTTLITSVSSQVVMINGGSPLNVYWQVGSSATIMDNTTMVGNIVAAVSITLNTGATVRGRTLAISGAITMISNVIDTSAYP